MLEVEKSGFSGGYLVISFIVGAITGVAVAMLTAPVSGREAREQIGRMVRRGRNKLSEAQDALREGLERGREKAREVQASLHEPGR